MRFACPRICSSAKNTSVYVPEQAEKKTTSVKSLNAKSQNNQNENKKMSIDQYSHAFIDEYASGEFSNKTCSFSYLVSMSFMQQIYVRHLSTAIH